MEILYIAVIVCLLLRILFLESQDKDSKNKLETTCDGLNIGVKHEISLLRMSADILKEIRLLESEIKKSERISDEQISNYIVQFKKLAAEINKSGLNNTVVDYLSSNLAELVEYTDLKRSHSHKLNNLRTSNV